MTEFNRHTDDAPGHWEEYAEILRNQPRPVMSEEHAARMLPGFDAALERRVRRDRVIRWGVAPALSILTIIAVIFFVNYSEPRPNENRSTSVRVADKPSEERPRSVRRSRSNRLPQPKISQTPQASIDSAPLVHHQVPVVEVTPSDPIAPGFRPAPGPGLKPASTPQRPDTP